MDNYAYCIAKKAFVNTGNLTARFDVKFIKENVAWNELSYEKACKLFPHKGMVFRFLKRDSSDFVSLLDRNDFFYIGYGENTRYEHDSDSRLDRYYAQEIVPLVPIIDSPSNWNNRFEIARQNLQQLEVRKEDIAYLRINDLYFKLRKREIATDEGDTSTCYEFDVQPNDKVTVIARDVPNQNQVIISGGKYCLDSDSVLRSEYYFSGKDSQFTRLIVNRFKDFSLQQGEFKKTHDALEQLKQLSNFFDTQLSKYDQVSLKDRISFLQNELLQEDSLKTSVLDTIITSVAFKRKLESIKSEKIANIEGRLDKHRLERERVIDDEFEQLTERNNLIASQVDTLRTEKAELEKIVSDERNELELIRGCFVDELASLKKSLINCSYTELPYAKAFAERMQLVLEKKQVDFFPSSVAPWQNPPKVDSAEVLTENEIVPHLATIAKVTAHDPEVLTHLDGFLRAGEVPFLYGEGSQSHLQQYANLISGGRLYRMQADPSTLSLDDLWRTPSSQLPTAFALAWNAALAEDQYHIVQVNIDESPCHLWIKGLFDVMHSSLRPRTFLIVLTGNHFLTHIDSAHWLHWVIPMKCVAPGVPTAPIPYSSVIPSEPVPTIENNSERFDKLDDLLRFKKLEQVSPSLAKLYSSWPQEIPESSWLQSSKQNFPY